MLTQTIRTAVAAGVLVTLAAPVANAQELAGSFEQLRVLLKRGEKVDVTDASGHEVSGKVADLSSSSVALIVKGMRREFSRDEVETIRAEREDRIADGARLGFGIGAGLGLLVGIAYAADDGGGWFIPVAALTYGGLGAGMGAGIDAMVRNKQVIYARSAGSAARVTVSPLIAPGRTGAMVSIGF